MTGMTDWDFEPLVVPQASPFSGLTQLIANKQAEARMRMIDLVQEPIYQHRGGGYFAGSDFLDTTVRNPFTAPGIVLRAPWKTETAERRQYGEPIRIPDDWMKPLTRTAAQAINDNFAAIVEELKSRANR